MSEIEPEVAYHLLLDPEERSIAALALRLLVSDEAHESQIRNLARDVLQRLDADPGADGMLTMPLSAEEMKITHTALKLLLNDSQRDQHTERQLLWQILNKLPDEHAIRAIQLD
jgi:uncharacterized protein (DUF2336 family)